jgi:chemotaxis family two-component system sensor histidine kinase/response regulator PixL
LHQAREAVLAGDRYSGGEPSLALQNFARQNRQNFSTVDFDSLEMDEYTEFNLVLYSALEETLQLQ